MIARSSLIKANLHAKIAVFRFEWKAGYLDVARKKQTEAGIGLPMHIKSSMNFYLMIPVNSVRHRTPVAASRQESQVYSSMRNGILMR